jgi:uncharacterized protein with FMN-binding domain
MGDTRSALQLAERIAGNSRNNRLDLALLYAGDACRIAGEAQRAISYYERVLKVRAQGNQEDAIRRNQDRARANIQAIRIFDSLDLSAIADGQYRAHAAGYAGDVHVGVSVRQGRIESVEVTQHKEKQYYAALTDTPQKIIQRQGVRGVDATTGATITSEAIINATAKALAEGLP